MKYIKIINGFLLLLLIASFTGCSHKNNESKKIKIGFLMETYDLDRWQRDEKYFTEKANALGAEVLRVVADGDQDRQNKQAETLITQGVDVLVVIPKNLNTASRIIKSAHEKNIPVIAYDRMINNCDLDMYITFDNEKVGYIQARGILEKVPQGNFILLGGAASDNNSTFIRKGQLRGIAEYENKTGNKINILADPFLDNWDREEARRKISTLLTKFHAEGKGIDAVIASNDATAGGTIAALTSENLQGKTAVSGQDAELAACQRIAEGTQTVTVYKPVRQLAYVSAETAVLLARHESIENISKKLNLAINMLNNGKKDVPSFFLEPVSVTRENLTEVIIKDGWHPMEKVFANVPKDKWPKR